MLHPPPLPKFLHLFVLFVISSQQLKRYVWVFFPPAGNAIHSDILDGPSGNRSHLDAVVSGLTDVKSKPEVIVASLDNSSAAVPETLGVAGGWFRSVGKTWYFDGQATTFKPSRIDLGIFRDTYTVYIYVNMCIIYIYIFIYSFIYI